MRVLRILKQIPAAEDYGSRSLAGMRKQMPAGRRHCKGRQGKSGLVFKQRFEIADSELFAIEGRVPEKRG